MHIFYSQIINILTNPPGNLIYHIVLAFAITAALQGVLISRRSGQDESLRRVLFGLGLLLAGQVGLFLTSGLAWQGLANPHVFLPPLDRAITLFSLVWIAWMWAFPQATRLGDALAGMVSVVLVIAFFFTLNLWSNQPPDLAYNGTDFDLVWELAALVVMVAGSLLLMVRRPVGWGIGLGFMLINLAGHTAQFLWPATSGDFAGAVRLAQLCSFPLLPALAQRGLAPASQPVRTAGLQSTNFKVAPLSAEKKGELEPGKVRERRRYSADPRVTQAWLKVASMTDLNGLPAALTHAVAQTMLTDICFLLANPGASGEVVFSAGYDLIREEEIASNSIPRDRLPSLVTALQRGRALRLEPGSSTPDLKSLGEHLGMGPLNNLLFIPLASQKNNLGGFLFLSPYTNRAWNAEDQSYFASGIEPLIQILQRPAQPVAAVVQAEAASGELDALRLQVEKARQDNERLLADLEDQRRQSAHPAELEALMVVQKEARETIASLQAENERLLQAIQPVSGAQTTLLSAAEGAHLESELRQTLQEIAHLQNRLAQANAQILVLEKQASHPPVQPENENREVVASISQELRQPMASANGYTDLLLSESVGILGALQHKFLERIKSSIERMGSILDDLAPFTSLQGGKVELTTQSVNASTAIDQAISETRTQMQEKNITLHIDIPEKLPQLFADRDAVLQILTQLLQNANQATPVEGTINLKVRVDNTHASEPYLLFQITDSGGGIAQQDLARVFLRRYRADNPLIQGVGDTGVGLSIAKTLTEAHGGRIWVESEPGKTSTFSILLPVHARSAMFVGSTTRGSEGRLE